MENFNWTEFTRKIAITAPTQVLYNAWAIPLELERWFLSEATFFNEKEIEIAKTQKIEANNTYAWQWHLYPVTEKGKITVANGKDHLQFTFAGDCLVDVFLEPYETGTIVSLTQKNIPTDNNSKKDIRLGCDKGWSFYLVNLKSVYQGGIDLRNKDSNLKPMLNN